MNQSSANNSGLACAAGWWHIERTIDDGVSPDTFPGKASSHARVGVPGVNAPTAHAHPPPPPAPGMPHGRDGRHAPQPSALRSCLPGGAEHTGPKARHAAWCRRMPYGVVGRHWGGTHPGPQNQNTHPGPQNSGQVDGAQRRRTWLAGEVASRPERLASWRMRCGARAGQARASHDARRTTRDEPAKACRCNKALLYSSYSVPAHYIRPGDRRYQLNPPASAPLAH